MNIKRLFPLILVLAMFVTEVYAANHSIGVITNLQLHKSEIFIDNQIYTIDPSVKIDSPEDPDIVNIYQLKINMGTKFNYQLNSDGTKTILDMEVYKELLP